MADAGFALGDPVFVRIFKRESLLELWLLPAGGAGFRLFRSYPVLAWSGELGPKLREGDRQAPEGFYRVAMRQLKPKSRHHLAFNFGFPNAFDRQLGRTGSALMVHGGDRSAGCYAIGDEAVDEVYRIVEGALMAGQDAFDVHCLPFRLTDAALAAMADHPSAAFWRNLRQGVEAFERDTMPPLVWAAGGHYYFTPDAGDATCEPVTAWQ